jgi:hypothetical protein
VIPDSDVVAEGRETVADATGAHLLRLERLDHVLLFGKPPNGLVAQDSHALFAVLRWVGAQKLDGRARREQHIPQRRAVRPFEGKLGHFELMFSGLFEQG